jgi:hypothetical protein
MPLSQENRMQMATTAYKRRNFDQYRGPKITHPKWLDSDKSQ